MQNVFIVKDLDNEKILAVYTDYEQAIKDADFFEQSGIKNVVTVKFPITEHRLDNKHAYAISATIRVTDTKSYLSNFTYTELNDKENAKEYVSLNSTYANDTIDSTLDMVALFPYDLDKLSMYDKSKAVCYRVDDLSYHHIKLLYASE